MSSKITKSQKRNIRRALKRKKRREERIDIRKIDELVQVALIEDNTWDAMCYKNTCLQKDTRISEQINSSTIFGWLSRTIKKYSKNSI